MTTEEKALALVNAEQEKRGFVQVKSLGDSSMRAALIAAIEAHEADKKAFSDVAERTIGAVAAHSHDAEATALHYLSPFILPEPDPLVEARRQIADRVLRQFGAPASDEDCIGLIVAALEEQAKIERIDDD